MAGRRPLPAKVHKQRGEPGKRKHAPNPEPVIGIPEPPESVRGNSRALAEYNRIAAELSRLRVLTVLDCGPLSNHVLAFAMREACFVHIINKHGLDAEGKKSPALTMAIDCMKLMETTGEKLGLNPLGRSRLHAPAESSSKDSALEAEFFSAST